LHDYILRDFDYKGFSKIDLSLGAVLYVLAAPTITVLLSWLSYKFFEKPFLRLKGRF
jgi:peptidoglycan/LPS O-acetylase OafA/YrhL